MLKETAVTDESTKNKNRGDKKNGVPKRNNKTNNA